VTCFPKHLPFTVVCTLLDQTAGMRGNGEAHTVSNIAGFGTSGIIAPMRPHHWHIRTQRSKWTGRGRFDPCPFSPTETWGTWGACNAIGTLCRGAQWEILVVACFEISRICSWNFAVRTNIYVWKLTRHILHVLQCVLLDGAPLCVP
jgi:hypothetical protein